MKNNHFKSLFLLFLLLSPAVIFGQNKSSGKDAYNIKLKVNGLPKDSSIFLAYYYGDKQYIKDTAKVDANGSFSFSGKEALPGGIYMAVLPGRKYFEFILKEQFFGLETDTNDYVANMKIKGSSENTIFYDYLKFIGNRGRTVDSLKKEMDKVKDNKDATQAIKDKIGQIDKEVISYKESTITNNPGTFVAMLFTAMKDPVVPENKNPSDSLFAFRYYRQHYFDNIDFKNGNILRTPIYHEKMKQFIENFTYRHPDSINKAADFLLDKAKANKELFKYSVFWLTNTHESANWMGADAIFVHMVEKYFMTGQADWLDTARINKIAERAMILKPLLIGKKAPNMYLQDTLGKTYGVHELKAKYTILYFWDPDCGHCQKATPKLYESYTKYKDKGVAVMAITSHGEEAKWRKYIKENKLHWINVRDTGPYYDFKKIYDIYSTPVIYILDEKKEIIAKRIG
ncbi:MAG TPA: thioredoxin-like domain-containing protein, partial [Cytophagaceae bacterium]